MNLNTILHGTARKALPALCFLFAVGHCSCSRLSSQASPSISRNDSLRVELRRIALAAPGKVGIALIDPDGDTLTVNNDTDYQLMSVFKLHEALAVAHALDSRVVSLDSVISFRRSELDPDTWSPMLDDHKEDVFNLSVAELLRYALQLSDNNASNLLFDRIVPVGECDSFIREATAIEDFSIGYSERQMHADHSLADGNHSSPLACARLIDKLFSDSIVSPRKQIAIQRMLLDCKTGTDRIYAPLKDVAGLALAHKTGSGFRDAAGRLKAHNDIGRVTLPDRRSYALAVMVKDFTGSEAEASAVIARISEAVFNCLSRK